MMKSHTRIGKEEARVRIEFDLHTIPELHWNLIAQQLDKYIYKDYHGKWVGLQWTHRYQTTFSQPYHDI